MTEAILIVVALAIIVFLAYLLFLGATFVFRILIDFWPLVLILILPILGFILLGWIGLLIGIGADVFICRVLF